MKKSLKYTFLSLALLLSACSDSASEKPSDLGTQVTEVQENAQTAPVILPTDEN